MTTDNARQPESADLRRNGAIERKLRFLITFGAVVAAVVVSAWASQARQDEAIRANSTAVEVVKARLDAICEKLDEIRGLVAPVDILRRRRAREDERLPVPTDPTERAR